MFCLLATWSSNRVHRPAVATNDVSKSRDVSRRHPRIDQHERVIASAVDDVIISWYQVDVSSGDVESQPGAPVPREVGDLFQVGDVVAGLEVTFRVQVFSQHVRRHVDTWPLTASNTCETRIAIFDHNES